MIHFLFALLEVRVTVDLDGEALILEVPEHVLSHAVDRVLLAVIKLGVLILTRNHRALLRSLLEVEVVSAEHVATEIFRQLTGFRYFDDEVNVLVQQVFGFFRNEVVIGLFSTCAVTGDYVHAHCPVQTEALRD